ncbi:MAG: tetratricopeptide repeat protein [bacterium]
MLLNLKDKGNLSILITLLVLVFCLIVINNYLSKKFKFALLIETSPKGTEGYLQPYMSKRKQIKELRKFIKKHPHTSEVIDKYIELGKIFEQIKSRREAYWTYKSAIRKEGDNPEIIKIYLLLINSVRNKKSALFKVYRDVSKKFPDDRRLADVYKGYAKMLEERKQKEEALKFYEIAAKYASRKEQLNILKKSAKAYLASGDNQKALEIYNKILKEFHDIATVKDIVEIYLSKSNILSFQEKYSEAIDVCNKVLSTSTLEADKIQILEQIALINESMGNYQKSLEIYKNIVKKDPKYLGRYFHIARLEERLGKSDTATEIYNDIITNNPDTIWAKNAMGELWVRDRSLKCPKRVYIAKRTSSPPKIDGYLSDACWSKAQKATDYFDYKSNKKASLQSVAMVTYDDKRIYFGFILYEKNLSKLLIKAKTRDDNVWSDDCMELFLDTKRDYCSYYHFIMNPKSVFYDGFAPAGYKSYSKAWNGNWNGKAKIHSSKGYWTGEASIDYSSLNIKYPIYNNEVWGINFNRARRAGKTELSCWSLTLISFHVPERFGYLVFE